MRKNLIIIAIALLLFTAGFFVSRSYWKAEAERYKNNYAAEVLANKNAYDGLARTITLNEAEFEAEYGKLIDSLDKLTEDRLKPSRVQSLTQIKIKKEIEEKIVWQEVRDTIYAGRKLQFADSCLKFTVYQPDSADYAVVSASLDLSADLVVYKGIREKQVSLFGLKLFRYGNRQPSAQVFSSCGNVQVKHVEVK